MGLIRREIASFGTVGAKTSYFPMTAQEVADVKKMRLAIVPPSGGTSRASGCLGFAKAANNQRVTSYGLELANFDTEDHTDKMVHLFNYDSNGDKETLLSVEFVEFDKSLQAAGLLQVKTNVLVADGSYRVIMELYS